MERKRVAVLIIFSMLIIVGLMFYLLIYQQSRIQGDAISNNANNTDFYGCLIHDGFSWNETELACVREWVPIGVVGRYQHNFNTSGSSEFNSSNETLINWTTNLVVSEQVKNSTSSNETNSTSENKTNQGLINWSKLFS